MVSIDNTFLNGKYRGVLLMDKGIESEDHLVPLGFALSQNKNDQSWSWLIYLVRHMLSILVDGSMLYLTDIM